MPHRPGDRLWHNYEHFDRLPVSHGMRDDAHMRARCGACDRVAPFDVGALFRRGLGGRRMGDVAARLRCRACGHVGGGLEVVFGAPGETPWT